MALGEVLSFTHETPESYQDIPEQFKPREYGIHNYDYAAVHLGKLIRVSHVRLGVNPALEELRESLERDDLLNAIDVALVDREMLISYLDFSNRLWGTNNHVDNYECDDLGLYYLVIAGHSRVEGMTDNEMDRSKRAAEAGYSTDPLSGQVMVKLHHVTEPEQILAIQLAENIHKEPSEERKAIAIVETFRYGLEIGKWINREQFLATTGKRFTRTMVERAMLFVELPEEARKEVLLGRYKYAIACEIGRLVKPYTTFLIREKLGDDPARVEANREKIIQTVTQHITNELELARKNKFTIKKVKARVRDYIQGYKSVSELEQQPEEQSQLFYSIDEEFRKEQRIIARRFRDTATELAGSQTVIRAKTLNMAKNLLEPDSPELKDINTLIAASNRKWDETLSEAG